MIEAIVCVVDALTRSVENALRIVSRGFACAPPRTISELQSRPMAIFGRPAGLIVWS